MDLKFFSLNIYSFGYYAGFIKDPNRKQKILGIDGLVKLAKTYGFGGVELPIDHFYDIHNIKKGVEKIQEIQSEGISVFIDLEKTNVDYIIRLLPYLPDLNIQVVRVKMDQIGKTIYGGNRYSSTTFNRAVQEFRQQLVYLLPALKKFDVMLAIENHQDFHSAELVEISNSISREFIGITWDVGNSISVVDSPDSFYNRAKHVVKNVHLKDYKVYKSESGVQLVRCPLGEGYVDYKNTLKKLLKNPGVVNMSIELGAQNPRECDIDNELYWGGFLGIEVGKNEYLNFVEHHTLGTYINRETMSEKYMIESELQDLESSVYNLKKILREINE